MKKRILAVIMTICFVFCACQQNTNSIQDMAQIQMFAMDTFIDLKAAGENGQQALLKAEKKNK